MTKKSVLVKELKKAVLKDDPTGDIGMLPENWNSIANCVIAHEERLMGPLKKAFEQENYVEECDMADHFREAAKQTLKLSKEE